MINKFRLWTGSGILQKRQNPFLCVFYTVPADKYTYKNNKNNSLINMKWGIHGPVKQLGWIFFAKKINEKSSIRDIGQGSKHASMFSIKKLV